MKNLMLAICFVAVGLVSCTSCSPSTTVPPDAGSSTTTTTGPEPSSTVPVPNPNGTVMTKSNWSLTLPGVWEEEDVCEPGFCPTVFFNDKQELLVVLTVDEFNGTLDEHVLMSVRGINEAKAEISEVLEVQIDGTKFVLLKSSKGEIKVSMWVTVSNGKAVSLSCGGQGNQELCATLATTLKQTTND